MIVGYNDEILICLHLSGMYLYFQLTTANYVHIHCTEVPGKSLPSKSFFFFEKHNKINIYIQVPMYTETKKEQEISFDSSK